MLFQPCIGSIKTRQEDTSQTFKNRRRQKKLSGSCTHPSIGSISLQLQNHSVKWSRNAISELKYEIQLIEQTPQNNSRKTLITVARLKVTLAKGLKVLAGRLKRADPTQNQKS